MKKEIIYEYIEDGFNVFPITPGEKTPLASELEGGSQNSSIIKPITEEQWEGIIERHPEVNIGIHTGEPSGVIVIDIDIAKTEAEIAAGKRTAEQALVLHDMFVTLFGDTRTHRTASGGYHLLYRYSEATSKIGRQIDAFKKVPQLTLKDDFGVTHILDLQHIDVLAGNGYFVAAPSSLGEGKDYSVVHATPSFGLADFPNDLLALLTPRTKKDVHHYLSLKNGEVPAAIPQNNLAERKIIRQWEAHGDKLLHSNLGKYAGTGSGGRNAALIKVCGTVFAMLPYSEWGTARKYVNNITSTFSPSYTEKDEREIQSAILWTQSKEYIDRTTKSAKDEEERQKEAQSASKELNTTPDTYAEDLQKCEDALQTDEKGNIIANERNASIVLSFHPKYKNSCRYDDFLEAYTFKGEKIHFTKANNPTLTGLQIDMQLMYFPKAAYSMIKAGFVKAARENTYDSYRDYMDSYKGKWDGVERLSQWLHKVYECPDDDYHKAVSQRFIFAMVQRAYEPGCDFQYTLFLRGEQGTGKSYGMAILGSKEADDAKWYLAYKDGIEGREFNLFAKGRAIIDLAEGESMSRSSQKLIKALISDSQGLYRDFGGEDVDEHKARYVLSVTNNNSPLIDATGNRRYLVVQIPLEMRNTGDITWLKAYKKQIFAEAVHYYHKMVETREEIKEKKKTAQDEELYELLKLEETMRFKERDHDLMTPFGIMNIPETAAEEYRDLSYMGSPLEGAVHEVLVSYDEYRAGMPDFVIRVQDVHRQLDVEIVRQSRVGSFVLNEINACLKASGNMEYYRARSGTDKNKRIWRLKHHDDDYKKKLDYIKSLRETAMNDTKIPSAPPSTMAGGHRMITEAQRAEYLRWSRDGGKFLVVTDEEIEKGVKYSELMHHNILSRNETARNSDF